ncbi:MAG TPA: DUF1570 domain-containing protein [Erythrobacter sp.]
MISVVLRILAAAAVLVVAHPALAEWHRAESDRFVIYSDSRPEDIAEYARMLERYHAAMELETGRRVPVPSPSNRLTVYLVGTIADVRELYGDPRSAVGGFYIPRAAGSVAFGPNIRVAVFDGGRLTNTRRKPAEDGVVARDMGTLLHEYAHHFLVSSARHAMPRWLSEGAAEYFSAARFNPDGSVDLGLPNNDRAWELSQAAPVSVVELLDYETYRKNRGLRYDAYYGRAWLLFHYLSFNGARAGQLAQYWKAVANGADSLTAGRQIFGDLDVLEKELRAYGRQRNMSGMRFGAEKIRIGNVAVTPLSEGHAAMMPVIMRSNRGVDEKQAQEVVAEARRIAARYPKDSAVMAALAEAEYDAGNDDAAIAAADAAIAADPKAIEAYVQKGYAMFRKAETAERKADALILAMRPFEAVNALESDHTQPLIYYYRSFTRRGATPPEAARHALERATELAPFDQQLAVEVALLKVSEGENTIARYLLAPVAADPHGGKRAAAIRGFMEKLAAVPDGQKIALASFDPASLTDDDAEGEGDDGEGDDS